MNSKFLAVKVAAINQEVKFMKDCDEVNKQYRNGYVQALRAVSTFLAGDCDREKYAGVDRLFAFAALLEFAECRTDRPSLGSIIRCQREASEIAADLICSAEERADFAAWLRAYEVDSLFAHDQSVCPSLPHLPVPRTESDLAAVEAEFDRRYS